MEYTKLDMSKYARKDHFNYFKSMAQPYAGVTVNVEITDFLQKTVQERLPFFLSFLYCVSNAANRVPQLRQRILGNEIIEYKRCPTSHTVALDDGTYGYCCLNAGLSFEDYLPYAAAEQERAKMQQGLCDEEDPLPLFFISTVPWLNYTALIQPVPSPADSNPRITWGRYEKQGSAAVLPVSILCHHALADGRHLAQFYERLKEELEHFCSIS